MNFTKTLLAVALLATGSMAQASTYFASTTTGTGSDAILTITDTTKQSFYALDLGVNYLSIGTASLTTLNALLAADSNLTTFLGNTAATDSIQYKIDGGKTNGVLFVTSVDQSVSLSAFNTQLSSSGTTLTGAISSLNAAIGSYSGTGAGAQSVTVANGGPGYTYASNSNAGGALNTYSDSVALNTAVNLFEEKKTGANTFAPLSLGTIELNQSGSTLSFSSGATTTSAVPLPTTAWMFLSGMVALLSVRNRKNTAV